MRASMTVRDAIGPVLAYKVVTTALHVTEAFRSGEARVEAYAKLNAPWTDQTGMARAGLTASVGVDGGEVVLTLAHSVDYGIWLELIQDGSYAIIMPTLEALGPEILRDAGAATLSVGPGGF